MGHGWIVCVGVTGRGEEGRVGGRSRGERAEGLVCLWTWPGFEKGGGRGRGARHTCLYLGNSAAAHVECGYGWKREKEGADVWSHVPSFPVAVVFSKQVGWVGENHRTGGHGACIFIVIKARVADGHAID